MIIKCFSLSQVWAEAMRLGLKRNETREKKTSYRGWLAIASTKTIFDPSKYNQEWVRYVRSVMSLENLSYGTIRCIVHLDEVIPTDSSEFNYSSLDRHEKQWGDYRTKRHVWQTSRLIVLPEDIPVQGRQWLFDWEVPAKYEYRLREKEHANN